MKHSLFTFSRRIWSLFSPLTSSSFPQIHFAKLHKYTIPTRPLNMATCQAAKSTWAKEKLHPIWAITYLELVHFNCVSSRLTTLKSIARHSKRKTDLFQRFAMLTDQREAIKFLKHPIRRGFEKRLWKWSNEILIIIFYEVLQFMGSNRSFFVERFWIGIK